MSTAFDYIQCQAKRQWDHSHSPGLLTRLFLRLIASRKIRGVWIEQYWEGNWESGRLKGEAIQAWRYDADGLTVVERLPELDKSSPIASTTPVISFCVDESAARMIYQEWHGGRAGFGYILAHRGNGEWYPVTNGWKC